MSTSTSSVARAGKERRCGAVHDQLSRYVGFSTRISRHRSTTQQRLSDISSGATAVHRVALRARAFGAPAAVCQKAWWSGVSAADRQYGSRRPRHPIGFKFFERRAVAGGAASCEVTGFAFDVELSSISIRRQCRSSFPVDWTGRCGTTLRPVRDGIPAFVAAMRLAWPRHEVKTAWTQLRGRSVLFHWRDVHIRMPAEPSLRARNRSSVGGGRWSR